MRPTGPMRASYELTCKHIHDCLRKLTCKHILPWSNATMIRAPPLRRNRASLSPAPLPPLRTFCPRVFGINRHFSQESALQRAQIRAPDWTYARGQPSASSNVPQLPWSVATIFDDCPRSAGTELCSHASQTPFALPPSDILSESFRHK